VATPSASSSSWLAVIDVRDQRNEIAGDQQVLLQDHHLRALGLVIDHQAQSRQSARRAGDAADIARLLRIAALDLALQAVLDRPIGLRRRERGGNQQQRQECAREFHVFGPPAQRVTRVRERGKSL
jgi:hypothetical protein